MKPRTIRAGAYLAVFAVITVALTYVLAVTISNGSVGSTEAYKANFSDATSLLKGDDVRIDGVKVGQVSGIKLRHDCPDAATVAATCAQVSFGLDKSIPLHTSAQAVLRYRNLIGQRYVEIDEAPGSGAVAPKGYLLPLTQTTPALDLTVLFDGFKPLFSALTPSAINDVSYEVVRTLQGEGGTLDTLLASTASLSSSVASQDAEIGSLIGNLDGVLQTVDARNGELDNLIDELQSLVTGLAGNRAAIAASLGNVDKLAVSTSTLLADIRPELPTDLNQLSAVANTLNTTTTTVGGKTQNQLDQFLNNLPTKINTLTRTATYGSWFNFYLCDANIALGTNANISLHSTNSTACSIGAAP